MKIINEYLLCNVGVQSGRFYFFVVKGYELGNDIYVIDRGYGQVVSIVEKEIFFKMKEYFVRKTKGLTPDFDDYSMLHNLN